MGAKRHGAGERVLRWIRVLLVVALPAVAATAEPGASGAATQPSGARKPFDAYGQAELAELVKKLDADHVIDFTPNYLLLLAKRPGPELAYGEPKSVALAVDRDLRITAELEVAWGVGDEGVSMERTWEYLRAGVLRVKIESTDCSIESQYQDCKKQVSVEIHRLTPDGNFEELTPYSRYCDRSTGEELELAEDPAGKDRPGVTYRSRRNPKGLQLTLVTANPEATRLGVRFPKSIVTYDLELRDDLSSLTSRGRDGSAVQTFLRGPCAR